MGFKPIVDKLGTHQTFLFGLAWTVLITLPIPVYCMTYSNHTFWRYVPVGVWQTVSQPGFSHCSAIISCLINKTCTPSSRGTINGWSNSLTALSRGIGPLGAGALVSIGCRIESHIW